MELICNMTLESKAILSNSLRSIYSSVVLYETYDDQSEFLNSIIELVESDLNNSQTMSKMAGVSYRISNVDELAAAFIKQYQKVIDKAGEFAYSINEKFGYTMDIASVVGPYILYQCGITDESITFYLALGMVLSNIICDVLAKHKENDIEKKNDDEMKAVCKSLYHLLEQAKKQNQLHGIHDSQIEKSLKEIEKILEENNSSD